MGLFFLNAKHYCVWPFTGGKHFRFRLYLGKTLDIPPLNFQRQFERSSYHLNLISKSKSNTSVHVEESPLNMLEYKTELTKKCFYSLLKVKYSLIWKRVNSMLSKYTSIFAVGFNLFNQKHHCSLVRDKSILWKILLSNR